MVTTAGIPPEGERDLILIIEDQELLSYTLCTALRARGFDTRTVRPVSHAQLLRDALELAPRLVILDLHLGTIGDSLPLVRPLVDAGSHVLIVTGSRDHVAVAACLEAGAVGVVRKDEPFDRLVSATCAALEGDDVMSQGQRHEYLTTLWEYRGRQLEAMKPFTRLTTREEVVLHRLCNGDSVHTIAATSYVSVPTVRTQVHSILQKLDASSQLEAVTRAYRSGWHVMREAYAAS